MHGYTGDWREASQHCRWKEGRHQPFQGILIPNRINHLSGKGTVTEQGASGGSDRRVKIYCIRKGQNQGAGGRAFQEAVGRCVWSGMEL